MAQEIIDLINGAFSWRVRPPASDIEPDGDPDSTREYFKEISKYDRLDRVDAVRFAFCFFSNEEAMYFLPIFMVEVMRTNKCDDPLIDAVIFALWYSHGYDMEIIATNEEKLAICAFVDWIQMQFVHSVNDPLACDAEKVRQIWVAKEAVG